MVSNPYLAVTCTCNSIDKFLGSHFNDDIR